MTSLRVLVAGDHKAVRDGLRLMLGLLGIEVPGAAAGGTDAARQAAAAVPGVVLMDLHLPDCDRVQVTRPIVRQPPHVRVMVLTGFSEDDPVFAALRAGARGLLTKNADAGEILQAMPAVRAGEAQLDISAQRRQAGAMVRGERPDVPGAPRADAAPDGLTQREVEVLTEIAAGLSNAEIAGKFRISGATVKTHINHLLTKTAARDRGQLVAYAFRHGLAA
jgi:DNA-binding NarL/FixJ family response regulator